MRTRVLVVLVALVAMALAPSEAVLAESTGSVVGQVASCIEASGLARDLDDASAQGQCDAVPRIPPGSTLLPIAVLALATVLAASLRVRHRRPALSAQRWRLVDAVAGPGAPWRAPPLPV